MKNKILELVSKLTNKLEKDKKVQISKLKKIKRKSGELASRIKEFDDTKNLLKKI